LICGDNLEAACSKSAFLKGAPKELPVLSMQGLIFTSEFKWGEPMPKRHGFSTGSYLSG
jgi:hypothetical protein